LIKSFTSWFRQQINLRVKKKKYIWNDFKLNFFFSRNGKNKAFRMDENGEANLGMASGNKTELDQREREQERERETLRKKSNGQNSLKVEDKSNIKKTKF